MNTYTFGFKSSLVAMLVVACAITVPSTTSADGFFDSGYDSGFFGGGYDGGFYGGGYDSGFSDGGYDSGFLDGGYDSGFYDGGYDSGYFDGGFNEDYSGFFGGGYEGYDSGFFGGGYEGYDAGYGGGYDAGASGYDAGYAGYDAGYAGYDAGYAGYDAGYAGYDAGYRGYDAGYSSCGSCYGTNFGGGFSFGGGGFGGVTPITISIPSRPQTPVFTGGGAIYNNNTNINNNSAVAIAQVIPAAPQYPVVYQAPAPSCVINHALAGGYYGSANMAYLSWSSQNATTAQLTSIGNVAVNGSQTVYPTVTTTYVLTVRNAQGQAVNCSTTVVVNQLPPVVPPPPVYNNQYCTIYSNPTTIQNGQSAVLSWSSTGATSAWLSDGIGSVALNGSLTVRPESSRVYTLTVYGPMGSKTCSTTLNVQGTYVSLTQIPYTGFDLGPIGNAMYWLGLITFAVAGAYLTLYHRGGMARLAYAFVPSMPKRTFTPVAFKKESTTLETSVPTNVQPIVNSIRKTNTVDAMAIVQSTDGSMPKIVITRN